MSLPRVVLCDLDGVVWLARRPIPGSVEAVARLRACGATVVFVTNNSFTPRHAQEGHLAEIGIEAAGCVATSSMAAGRLLRPGWRVLVCGGEGLVEETERAGATALPAHEHKKVTDVDAVVVGLHREVDYDVIATAARCVRGGALFVASNTDPVYPTPDGPLPGGGALVAAIATAAETEPVVAGKPHSTMAELVRAMTGELDARDCWMVGDRADTDGRFAEALGVRFAHVLSGTSTDGGQADMVCADLAGVADVLTSGST